MAEKDKALQKSAHDLRAIQVAEVTIGDKKLKSSPDYIVPEHLRMNAAKKRRQMLMLEESIYNEKMEFNNRLMGMRDLKVRLIEKIKNWNKRIREINTQLNVDETLIDPEFDDSEWPNHYYIISNEDLEQVHIKKAKTVSESEMSKSFFEGELEEEEEEEEEEEDEEGS